MAAKRQLRLKPEFHAAYIGNDRDESLHAAIAQLFHIAADIYIADFRVEEQGPVAQVPQLYRCV